MWTTQMLKGGRCYACVGDIILRLRWLEAHWHLTPEVTFFCVWVCNLVDRCLPTELYRVIHNSLTHVTKPVHLNGEKDFNMRPTYRKRNSKFFCTCRRRGRQGSMFWENGGDGSREGFLRAWICTNTDNCGCAGKFFGPSSERASRWGTVSSSGMKNSSVTGACASHNAQHDQALRKRERSVWGRFFKTASLRPLTEQVESWVSHSLPCCEFFASVCGWSQTGYSYCRL